MIENIKVGENLNLKEFGITTTGKGFQSKDVIETIDDIKEIFKFSLLDLPKQNYSSKKMILDAMDNLLFEKLKLYKKVYEVKRLPDEIDSDNFLIVFRFEIIAV